MKTRNELEKCNQGFSLIELMVVIAIIGILAGIALVSYSSYRGNIRIAEAKTMVRSMQVQAISYFEAHNQPPTIEQLDYMINRNSSDTIIGDYKIVSPWAIARAAHDAGENIFGPINGYLPDQFVICSTKDLIKAEYVYSLDDKAPRVAEKGTNPLGVIECGPAYAGPPAEGDDDDDTSGNPDDDDTSADDDDDTSNPADDDDDTSSADDDDEDPGIQMCEESVDSACPCEGEWQNHGKYVTCVTQAAQGCVTAGLINPSDKGGIISERAQSDCGQ